MRGGNERFPTTRGCHQRRSAALHKRLAASTNLHDLCPSSLVSQHLQRAVRPQRHQALQCTRGCATMACDAGQFAPTRAQLATLVIATATARTQPRRRRPTVRTHHVCNARNQTVVCGKGKAQDTALHGQLPLLAQQAVAPPPIGLRPPHGVMPIHHRQAAVTADQHRLCARALTYFLVFACAHVCARALACFLGRPCVCMQRRACVHACALLVPATLRVRSPHFTISYLSQRLCPQMCNVCLQAACVRACVRACMRACVRIARACNPPVKSYQLPEPTTVPSNARCAPTSTLLGAHAPCSARAASIARDESLARAQACTQACLGTRTSRDTDADGKSCTCWTAPRSRGRRSTSPSTRARAAAAADALILNVL